MFPYEFRIIKVVDSHSFTYICKSPGCLCACNLATFAENLIHLRDILLVDVASFTDRLEYVLHDVEEEFLACAVSEASPAIMSLHFLKVLIVRKEFCKMFIGAECIKIGEYDISLDFSRVSDLKVTTVGVHAVDFLFHFLGCVGKVDAVAERLAHLGLSVSAREAAAYTVGRKHDFRSYQSLAIYGIEFMYDFSCLFNHRALILAHRDSGCPECCDV